MHSRFFFLLHAWSDPIANSQSEQLSHQRTQDELERERERARFAESELAILKRQLNREKTTFEDAYVCSSLAAIMHRTH